MTQSFQKGCWEGPSNLQSLRTLTFYETAADFNHERRSRAEGGKGQDCSKQSCFALLGVVLFCLDVCDYFFPPLLINRVHPWVTWHVSPSSLCFVGLRGDTLGFYFPHKGNLVTLTASYAATYPGTCSWCSP